VGDPLGSTEDDCVWRKSYMDPSQPHGHDPIGLLVSPEARPRQASIGGGWQRVGNKEQFTNNLHMESNARSHEDPSIG